MSARASGALSPLTDSGETIGFALAIALRIRTERLLGARFGTSTGMPRIASIPVASPMWPPYSFTDCEIAPMLRLTPAPSGQ